MERKYLIGQHIKYVDKFGVARDALTTIWWMPQDVPAYESSTGEPGCNLVIVSGDKEKDDSYGRQIERETSVVHKSYQVAHGCYWCWPDEL